MIKDLIKLGVGILFGCKDDAKYKSKSGFTVEKYRTLKSKVSDYAQKNGIGLVKAADTILKGNDHHIFFQGLKYEGHGNKI